MTQITVVICTYNRSEYLKETLESLTRQSLLQDEFKVLVVDNGSIDKTRQVSSLYINKLPLQIIFEPRLGLSIARNRGLDECTSEFVCFLDDDVIASNDLLKEILVGFQTFLPRPTLLGGKVLLNWNGNQPMWLPEQYFNLYSMLDYGEQTRLLAEREYIVGANFSAQVDFLRSIGGFQPTLGRRGTKLLSGEETQILHKARQAGLHILYQPKALVWHTVTAERKNLRWLTKRIFWDGASQPLLDYGANQSSSFYIKQVYHDLRRMLRFSLDAIWGPKHTVYPIIQRSGRLRTNLSLLLQSRSKDR